MVYLTTRTRNSNPLYLYLKWSQFSQRAVQKFNSIPTWLPVRLSSTRDVLSAKPCCNSLTAEELRSQRLRHREVNTQPGLCREDKVKTKNNNVNVLSALKLNGFYWKTKTEKDTMTVQLFTAGKWDHQNKRRHVTCTSLNNYFCWYCNIHFSN